MIKKTKGGYVIYSETNGRKLSRVYTSRKAAEKRLREIEYFKQNKKGGK